MKKYIIASLLAILMVSNANAMLVENTVSPIFENSYYTQLYFYTHAVSANKLYLNVSYSPDQKAVNPIFFGADNAGKTISGDFDGDGYTDYAFVKVEDKKIRWRSKTLDKTVDFGGKAAKILTNCDFNGDGKTELVYVKDKIAYYRTMDDDTTSQIALPKKNYAHMICADVFGAGYTQIVAKKQLSKKVKKQIVKYWVTDIITRDGANDGNTMKNIEFGGTTQGNLFALDINNDQVKEIGFAKKGGSNKTIVVFLNNLFSVADGADPEVTRYTIPRLAMKSGDAFEITPAALTDGLGFYLKNKNGFFSYSITANDVTKIGKLSELVSSTAVDGADGLSAGMAKLFLVKDSDFISLAGEDAGSDVQCDVWRGKGNGFLWKGKGEAYGGVAAGILPIYTKATVCQIVSSAGKSESMWCSAQGANPFGGVKRQHWRSRQTCGHYTKPSTLRCNVKGKWQCWKLANPCDRIE